MKTPKAHTLRPKTRTRKLDDILWLIRGIDHTVYEIIAIIAM